MSISVSPETTGLALRWRITGGGTDGFVGDGDVTGLNNAAVNFGGPIGSGAHDMYAAPSLIRVRLNDSIPNWSSGQLTIQPYWAVNTTNTGRLNIAGSNANHDDYTIAMSSFSVSEVVG